MFYTCIAVDTTEQDISNEAETAGQSNESSVEVKPSGELKLDHP